MSGNDWEHGETGRLFSGYLDLHTPGICDLLNHFNKGGLWCSLVSLD
jgi:hypothetical protein